MTLPSIEQVVARTEQDYATELVRMIVANNDASVARAALHLAFTLGAVAVCEAASDGARDGGNDARCTELEQALLDVGAFLRVPEAKYTPAIGKAVDRIGEALRASVMARTGEFRRLMTEDGGVDVEEMVRRQTPSFANLDGKWRRTATDTDARLDGLNEFGLGRR